MIAPRNETLNALEWPRFLELAATETRTRPGRALIEALAEPGSWAASAVSAQSLQQETQEALQLLARDSLWGPLMDLGDPEPALERLQRGAVMELKELALLRRWLYAVDSWTQVPRDEIRGERFRKSLGQLADPFEPLRILDRVLTPEGELSERASPKLASLYSEIRALRKEIGVVLDHVVKALSQKGVLQESFTDLRDGRYVIPIKISSQNEVEGTLYEASVSRQTVFIEPQEVSPLNNRLRQRQNDLIQEIHGVLTETSKRLQPFASEFRVSFLILSHWDSVAAKARLSHQYGGKAIHVSEERKIRLDQTAHPLLWWSLDAQSIVRNDIEFGDPAQTFLLTGPNTGGKTVLLKTLGLAGICARTGFPFPGTGQPQMPLFDSFFADLGDPQSIEQHLSSFSGHVLRFKEALEQVTPRSLVLIDELNTATDPEEGAALGRAFLETLMSKGAFLVSTTHDPKLKALAVQDPRILNASMAFDEASRTPTYRIVLGVPGRSRALETARRLGIPEPVLKLAEKYLSREHLEFESLLSRLETDVREQERARKEAVLIREEAEKLKLEWTERTQSQVGELLEKTRQRLRRILEQAQDEVRSSVKKLDEMKSRREIDQTRSQLNETFGTAVGRLESALSEEAPELAEKLAQATPPPSEASAKPAIATGTQVRIPKWKSTGTILEIHGSKVKVAMGSIQVSLSVHDVDPLTAAEAAQLPRSRPSPQQQRAKARLDTPPAPPPQLDLRGVRFDDAMSQVERYLDQAFRSGSYVEVTIVHGLGTGALREGARKILKSLPYVKTYRDGGLGAGGAGATLVEFDRD